MRIINAVLFIVLISAGPLFSWDKKLSTTELQIAQKKMSDLEYNFELKKFIPHDFYAEAVISLRKAGLAMEKKDYLNAYYHSSMAIVKTETTTVVALVRKTRETLTKLEIDHLKKQKSKKTKKSTANEIIDANLLKKGNAYRIVFPDKNIFVSGKYTLNEFGEESLYKLVKVLEKFKKSTVKIAGHSKYRDLKHYTKRKADFIRKFLAESGIDEERISTVGAGNHEAMDTAVGFRRVNRIEIVISGIDQP